MNNSYGQIIAASLLTLAIVLAEGESIFLDWGSLPAILIIFVSAIIGAVTVIFNAWQTKRQNALNILFFGNENYT